MGRSDASREPKEGLSHLISCALVDDLPWTIGAGEAGFGGHERGFQASTDAYLAVYAAAHRVCGGRRNLVS